MTRIHIVTGDKGNVGKSAWCSAMIEYYRHYGRSLSLIDADADSQTLSKIYKSAFPVMFSDDIAYAPLADSIYEIAYGELQKKSKGGDVLVDLPAGGEKFINRWIDECGITERAMEDGVALFKWWVSDSDANSIQMFEEDVERYPSIKHVFLKNMGRSSSPQWIDFERKKKIQSLAKEGQIDIFEIPAIPPAILDELRKSKAKLVDVLNDEKYKKFGLSKGMRVRGWITNTQRLLDSANAIEGMTVADKKEKSPVGV
ncbi:MAG: hypothetical protein AB8B99_17580 [Phormidesmis sp.]